MLREKKRGNWEPHRKIAYIWPLVMLQKFSFTVREKASFNAAVINYTDAQDQ